MDSTQIGFDKFSPALLTLDSSSAGSHLICLSSASGISILAIEVLIYIYYRQWFWCYSSNEATSWQAVSYERSWSSNRDWSFSVSGYASNSAEVRHGSSKPPWNASQVALCDSSLMPSCILMMVSCYQIHRPIGVCMVGGLQYLTLTRPDISFAVGLVDKFMQSPRSLI